MRSLSKSDLTAFRQCPKRLWMEEYNPDAKDNTAAARGRMSAGNQVGELARSLLSYDSEGQLIDLKVLSIEEAIDETLLAIRRRQAVYEAAFRSKGAHCFVDILLPVSTDQRDEWRIIEVKSTTKPKAYHQEDIAIQTYIAREAGLTISSVELGHINSAWTYRGNGEYQGFLQTVDVTDAINAVMPEVENWIATAQYVLAASQPPTISTGKHCSVPHACGFKHVCDTQQARAEFPIEWFAGALHKDIQAQKLNNPVLDMRDVDDSLLTSAQRKIKAATVTNEVYFDCLATAEDLKAHPLPVYFLDFETVQLVVPRWVGTKPYQQIPFQFSVHKLCTLNQCEHAEFLDLSGNDPSRGFAEKLLVDCGKQGAIFVYNASFEKARVCDLAERFGDLAASLLSLNERMVDLYPIAKKHFYHPSQHGSWSIKHLLPAVCPDMKDSYELLNGVQNGVMAMDAYHKAVDLPDTSPDKELIAKSLREYCALDTWAMVRLWSEFTDQKLDCSSPCRDK